MLIRDQDSGVEQVKCRDLPLFIKERGSEQWTPPFRGFSRADELYSYHIWPFFRPILYWLDYVYGYRYYQKDFAISDFGKHGYRAYLYKNGVTILYSIPKWNRADVSCTDRYFIWTTFGREVIPTIGFPHGVLVCLQYCVRPRWGNRVFVRSTEYLTEWLHIYCV